jgi:hypothetical protein
MILTFSIIPNPAINIEMALGEEPAFKVGDQIRISVRYPVGHYRVPMYMRGKRGIVANGMKVFSRINHAALAAEIGMTLRPTEVILFGNPRGGTPLMQTRQTTGIDLPLKALVWQDASGTTWLS